MDAQASSRFKLGLQYAVGTDEDSQSVQKASQSFARGRQRPLAFRERFANLDMLRRWMRAGTELGACRSFVPPSATAMGRRKYYEDDGGARGAPKVPMASLAYLPTFVEACQVSRFYKSNGLR